MLKVMNLAFSYKKEMILKDISFELDTGQSVCLLGKNGVGKSTMFKCLLRLLEPTAGKILIDGREIQSYSREKLSQLIAYIPQKQIGHLQFTVFEMVLMGTTSNLKSYQQPGPEEYELAEAALIQLNISRLKNKLFTEISGGEQQLVIIARSIAQQSHIIIMDEPCANLDYGNQIMILEMIQKLCAQGYLIIQATHDPNHALQYADQVLILQEGELVANGVPKEVLTENQLEELYRVPITIYELNTKGQSICLPKKVEI